MRFTKTLMAGAAALALMAGPALAQPGPEQGHDQHGGQQHDQGHGPQGGPNDHGPQGGPGDHGPQGRPGDHGPQGGPNNYHHEDYHHGPSGPHGQWARGDHFNGTRRVIPHGDWNRYHLHAPPPGYEWVNYNGQFIMIAITSGIIASIIAGSAYGY